MKHLVENKMSCLKDARMHSTITITDVREAINNLSTGKAVGFDSIPSEMFKAGVNTALSIVVTWLMDAMWSIGHITPSFNISLITPIPKPGKAHNDASDFRPISVSTSLATIFEEIVRQNICLNISCNQFGFKPYTSTKHSFFVVRETLEHYKRGGSYCWAASLDATKAFDRLWRDGLFVKLIIKYPMWFGVRYTYTTAYLRRQFGLVKEFLIFFELKKELSREELSHRFSLTSSLMTCSMNA